jgi:hypothetical protein
MVSEFKDFVDKALGQYYSTNPVYARIWKCLECNSIAEIISNEESGLSTRKLPD